MALSLVSAELALSVRIALPASLPVQFQFIFSFSDFDESWFTSNLKFKLIWDTCCFRQTAWIDHTSANWKKLRRKKLFLSLEKNVTTHNTCLTLLDKEIKDLRLTAVFSFTISLSLFLSCLFVCKPSICLSFSLVCLFVSLLSIFLSLLFAFSFTISIFLVCFEASSLCLLSFWPCLSPIKLLSFFYFALSVIISLLFISISGF